MLAALRFRFALRLQPRPAFDASLGPEVGLARCSVRPAVPGEDARSCSVMCTSLFCRNLAWQWK
jgi:hypothetical protein